MADRSSRPHSSPTKTPPQLVRQIVRLRWRHRLGPVQIAGRLGLQASTVHAVLVRCRINRLSHIDRVTGEPLRRYEHPHPGSLIHVDVTKFANIPDGGGHKFLSRQQSRANGIATALRTGERGKPLPTGDRHGVRPYRHRRPLPPGLRRDLQRRESGRSAYLSGPVDAACQRPWPDGSSSRPTTLLAAARPRGWPPPRRPPSRRLSGRRAAAVHGCSPIVWRRVHTHVPASHHPSARPDRDHQPPGSWARFICTRSSTTRSVRPIAGT